VAEPKNKFLSLFFTGAMLPMLWFMVAQIRYQ